MCVFVADAQQKGFLVEGICWQLCLIKSFEEVLLERGRKHKKEHQKHADVHEHKAEGGEGETIVSVLLDLARCVLHEQELVCLRVRVFVCVCECVSVCMYVCMYVCM
jgi:hypothetical protein